MLDASPAALPYGTDQKSGPTDFHAYVEGFLSNCWYVFDPSGISPPMGLVRIGIGQDAADASFTTVFGAVATFAPVINIAAIDDPANGFTLPRDHGDFVYAAAFVKYQQRRGGTPLES